MYSAGLTLSDKNAEHSALLHDASADSWWLAQMLTKGNIDKQLIGRDESQPALWTCRGLEAALEAARDSQ